MRKIDAMNKANQLNSIDCNVTPIKGVDSGSKGKSFEILVKLFVQGRIYSPNAISSKGKYDMCVRGIKYEIKSGCGTLDNVLNRKCVKVIYSYDSTIANAVVLDTEDFITILEECGLIRDKKTTQGTIVKAIQSFKNSNKKFTKFVNLLNAKGDSILEYF